MSRVRRVFVEKRDGFNIVASQLLADFRSTLGKQALKGVRVLIRYDMQGIRDELFDAAVRGVFSEPAVDTVYYDTFPIADGETSFAVEYLPGQYDQRADSAAQCIELLTRRERPLIRCATVYVLSGITGSDIDDIKRYIINPVDSREAAPDLPDTLEETLPTPPDVETLGGFCSMDDRRPCCIPRRI